MGRVTVSLAGIVIALCCSADAFAQVQYPVNLTARVTSIVDGDTLKAQLTGGNTITVQLVGIDAPEPTDCDGRQAKAFLKKLVGGRNVVLSPDSAAGQADGSGRSLFYVDRTDGLDAGRAMVRAGHADVLPSDFARSDAYADAEDHAANGSKGVWSRCDGDFHFTRAEQRRAKRRAAVAFVRRYYSSVSHRRFVRAWQMLGPALHRQNGSLEEWKSGFARSLGISVLSAHARLAGSRAVVAVSLRSRDKDICNGRVVRQSFGGSWVLAPRGAGFVAVKAGIHKTGGGHVRVSKSECPQPKPTPRPISAPPPTNCQGYSPCIPPGPDVDCAGGSGNGPRYVNGPVSVTGDDPYGLDDDGNGVGCES